MEKHAETILNRFEGQTVSWKNIRDGSGLSNNEISTGLEELRRLGLCTGEMGHGFTGTVVDIGWWEEIATCRFRPDHNPSVMCCRPALWLVSLPVRHKYPVCEEHVHRYQADKGASGPVREGRRRAVDSQVYHIESIESKPLV